MPEIQCVICHCHPAAQLSEKEGRLSDLEKKMRELDDKNKEADKVLKESKDRLGDMKKEVTILYSSSHIARLPTWLLYICLISLGFFAILCFFLCWPVFVTDRWKKNEPNFASLNRLTRKCRWTGSRSATISRSRLANCAPEQKSANHPSRPKTRKFKKSIKESSLTSDFLLYNRFIYLIVFFLSLFN